jgi:diacylglycerol kinase (ATP)
MNDPENNKFENQNSKSQGTKSQGSSPGSINKPNTSKSGFLGLLKRRILGASTYSWQGLKACFKHEEAFRVEVAFAVLLVPLALLIAATPVESVLLIGSIMLVLIVELLNSAVEAVVDRISEEHHELAGRAKDLGSAAVMLSMGLFFVTWLFIGLS